MKQKLFMMLAALMLMGTSAMAQSETLKGDVNADGVVDVADINAVINIMIEANDPGGVYYWYAGWTEPTEENIAEIVKETYPSADGSTTMNPAGFSSTTLAGVVMDFGANPLYDQETKDKGKPYQWREVYFVLPRGYGIYNPNMQMFVQNPPSFVKVGEFPNHIILKGAEGAASKIGGGHIIKEIE